MAKCRYGVLKKDVMQLECHFFFLSELDLRPLASTVPYRLKHRGPRYVKPVSLKADAAPTCNTAIPILYTSNIYAEVLQFTT